MPSKTLIGELIEDAQEAILSDFTVAFSPSCYWPIAGFMTNR